MDSLIDIMDIPIPNPPEGTFMGFPAHRPGGLTMDEFDQYQRRERELSSEFHFFSMPDASDSEDEPEEVLNSIPTPLLRDVIAEAMKLNRYPNLLPTAEVRLLKKYPVSTALQPYVKDCGALGGLKTYYNEEFQRQYNLFERVFGPNPLADWDGIEKFQNNCSATLNQYMMHRQFCPSGYATSRACICHRGYNPTSLFTGTSGAAVEKRRYELLLREYRSFWHELSTHWITKCINLVCQLRSGEEPMTVETEYPEGWTVISFYRGYAEVQDDEEEFGDDFAIREVPWANAGISNGQRGAAAPPPRQPLNELPHLTSAEWLGDLEAGHQAEGDENEMGYSEPRRRVPLPMLLPLEGSDSERDIVGDERWPANEIAYAFRMTGERRVYERDYEEGGEEGDGEEYEDEYEENYEEDEEEIYDEEEEDEERIEQEYLDQVLEASRNGTLV